jgi:hypothetical protein
VDDWGCGGDDWGADEDTNDVEDLTNNLQALLALNAEKAKEAPVRQEKTNQTQESPTGIQARSTSQEDLTAHQFQARWLVFVAVGYSISTNYRLYLTYEQQLYAGYQECSKRNDSKDHSKRAKSSSNPTKSNAKTEEISVSWDAEAFEEDPDKVFKIFRERLQRHPAQCVRYAYGGEALASDQAFLASASDSMQSEKSVCLSTETSTCLHCHGPTVFEAQLMPNLLNVLEPASTSSSSTEEKQDSVVANPLEVLSSVAPFEWTTVDLFVCARTCRKGEIVTEHHRVQPML